MEWIYGNNHAYIQERGRVGGVLYFKNEKKFFTKFLFASISLNWIQIIFYKTNPPPSNCLFCLRKPTKYVNLKLRVEQGGWGLDNQSESSSGHVTQTVVQWIPSFWQAVVTGRKIDFLPPPPPSSLFPLTLTHHGHWCLKHPFSVSGL